MGRLGSRVGTVVLGLLCLVAALAFVIFAYEGRGGPGSVFSLIDSSPEVRMRTKHSERVEAVDRVREDVVAVFRKKAEEGMRSEGNALDRG